MKRLMLATVITSVMMGWSCSSDPDPVIIIPPTPLPPTITAINPVTGPTTGGTTVTVNGTNFVSGATVSIGGVPATNVSVLSPASLTARSGVRLDTGASNVVVTNPDGRSVTLTGAYDYRPVLVANPGSGYSVDAERDIDLTSAASTSHPFPIAHFFWDCGQDKFPTHRVNCQPDTPSPRFRYRKEGFIRDGPRDYTVTLTIEDTRGNRSATASTTVRVRMVY